MIHRTIKISLLATVALTTLTAQAAQPTCPKHGKNPICYQTIGHGSSIVMLPGTFGTSETWPKAMLRLLAKHHTLWLLNYPGVGGRLAANALPKNFAAVARSINRFIRRHDLQDPTILGWSFGSMVAQQLALSHPNSRLVLISAKPGLKSSIPPKNTVRKLFRNVMRASGKEKIAYAKELSHMMFYPQSKYPKAYLNTFPRTFRTPPAVTKMEVGLDAVWAGTLKPRDYKRITAPVLIITGADDVFCPTANSTDLFRLLPNKRHNRLVRLRNSGHGVMYQHPIRVARYINKFLATT